MVKWYFVLVDRNVRKRFCKSELAQISLFDGKFDKKFYVPETVMYQVTVRVDKVISARCARSWILKKIWGILVWKVGLVRWVTENWRVAVERVWRC